MEKRCLMIGMVLFVSFALLPTFTWGFCEQEDLEGTWETKVWRGNFRGEQCWDGCILSISSDGTIAKGKYLDCLDRQWKIIGGQLTILSNCVIEGTIETSERTLYIERGAIVGDNLVLDMVENRMRFHRGEYLLEVEPR